MSFIFFIYLIQISLVIQDSYGFSCNKVKMLIVFYHLYGLAAKECITSSLYSLSTLKIC